MSKVDLQKRFLQEYSKLPLSHKDRPLFLGVSGGMDSGVLAHVVLSLRKKLPPVHWVHVNYHLRVPGSDRDEELLNQWSAQENIPLHVKSYYPKTKPNNLQDWARRRRLKFFHDTVKKMGKGKGVVCLAHHQRDQAETILTRMIQGSGLRGIGGMNKLENVLSLGPSSLEIPLFLFRPFLEVPHEALRTYAKFHRVPFLQDQTNEKLDYLRNRLRHQMLPWLHKENPNIQETLVRLGERSRQAQESLESLGSAWLKRHRQNGKGRYQIPTVPLATLTPGVRDAVLTRFLSERVPGRLPLGKILAAMVQFLGNPRGSQKIPLKEDFILELGPRQFRILR